MAAAAASTAAAGKTVCVTGASGFVAGHLISQLLAKGNIVRRKDVCLLRFPPSYSSGLVAHRCLSCCVMCPRCCRQRLGVFIRAILAPQVHGTVRSLSNATKTAHLTTLPGADERLKLFEADLLKAGSFDEALAGCSACYHTASPFFNDGVTDPEAQLIRPAVEGTLNVLNSCKSQGVKTIVVTSSTAAVYGRKEGNPPGHVITEEQWADADLATENKYHYVVSKIKAEQAVWKFASEEYPEARIVTLNPTLVIGPMFQPVMNTSSDAIARVSPFLFRGYGGQRMPVSDGFPACCCSSRYVAGCTVSLHGRWRGSYGSSSPAQRRMLSP